MQYRRNLLNFHFSCRLRVVIPFGMDAEFNYRDYKGPVMGTRSQQGNWNLNLKQFMSKYRECWLANVNSSRLCLPAERSLFCTNINRTSIVLSFVLDLLRNRSKILFLNLLTYRTPFPCLTMLLWSFCLFKDMGLFTALSIANPLALSCSNFNVKLCI